MADIADSFYQSGKYDEIVLISGKPISTRAGSVIKYEKVSPYNRKNIRTRLYSWVVGYFQILFKILFKFRHSELFIVSNPPLLSFLTYFRKKNYSVLIYDIYPDALASEGFISDKNILYKCWTKANKCFFKNASYVYTISEGMANRLSKYGNNIKVIPIWYNSDLNYINKNENQFIIKHHLKNKFIVLYSGNIGKGHNIKLLVQVAERLKDNKDIMFVIIGEGWEKKQIEEYVREHTLTNILILPYQPYDQLSMSLSSADLAYISVEDKAATLCVPSKTFNFLKLGVPLLCIASENSELTNLVDKYKIGAVFKKDEIDGIKSYILHLKSNPEEVANIKTNVLRASKDFSPQNAKQFII